MLTKAGRILFLAAHTDDVELGCGATAHRLAFLGSEIRTVVFSYPPSINVMEFEPEHIKACAVLGIKPGEQHLMNPRDLHADRKQILQILYDINYQFKPTLVFCPCSYDMHQSHRVVFEETVRAFKYSSILGYEMPWNCLEFRGNLFSMLAQDDYQAKLDAVACYKSQMQRTFFSNGVVGDLMRVRGKSINREYAEAFEAVRIVI